MYLHPNAECYLLGWFSKNQCDFNNLLYRFIIFPTRSRLKAKNLMYVNQLLSIMETFIKFLEGTLDVYFSTFQNSLQSAILSLK